MNTYVDGTFFLFEGLRVLLLYYVGVFRRQLLSQTNAVASDLLAGDGGRVPASGPHTVQMRVSFRPILSAMLPWR